MIYMISYNDYINEVVKPQKATRGFKMSDEAWNKACSKFPTKSIQDDIKIIIGNAFVTKRDLIIKIPMDIGGYIELSYDLTWGRGTCLEVQCGGLIVKQWNFNPHFEG